MPLPIVHGIIARRLLVNYRVDPEVIAPLLPAPFRPKLIRGTALAGICLIRLQALRPRGLPALVGLTSENAAHRIAVEWDNQQHYHEGVYIPRRDTNSRLTTLVGGHLFPGLHHYAHFTTTEDDQRISVAFTSNDQNVRVTVAGRTDTTLPNGSVFSSLTEASQFFERGRLGYSATRDPQRFDGLELKSRQWQVAPFTLEHVESSFFENTSLFPPGTARLDCALLMRGIVHEWHGHDQLCSPSRRAG
jgi:uncharacterized protein YqjF (DUF2071 family)